MQPRTTRGAANRGGEHVRQVQLRVGLFAVATASGCFQPGGNPGAAETAGSTGAETESVHSMSPMTADDGATGAGSPDGNTADDSDTSDPATTDSATSDSSTSDSDTSGSDTSGCEPAVFGLSTLNESCFQ